MIKEECGIAAVGIKKDVGVRAAEILYIMELHLQNRGQESAGIVTFNQDSQLKRYVELGEVDEVFRARDRSVHGKILDFYAGRRGIGHVRYSTSGAEEYGDLIREAQPFLREHGRSWKGFGVAFNGNLANHQELARSLREEGYILGTNVDTEVLMHHLSLAMKNLESGEDKRKAPDITEVVRNASQNWDGSYNVVFLNGAGDLAVFRDHLGFKPLFYSEDDSLFAAASESTALEAIGFDRDNIKLLEPGGLISLKNRQENSQISRFAECKRKALCSFEGTYFMYDTSLSLYVPNRTVNSDRRKLGLELALSEPILPYIIKNRDNVIVVPVPDTAKPAAAAYAQALGLRYVEAIRKKEVGLPSGRGFIQKPDMRRETMDHKYSTIRELVKGMIVIMVDDSLVRGDTKDRLMSLVVKRGGAQEAHLRLTFPPIRNPCFYGIDFPTFGELAAARYSTISRAERYLAKQSGLKSLHYQTLEGLVRAFEISEEDLCTACITGEYPTTYGQVRYEEALQAS